jgi:predicted DNA-binding ribbon-helix-helix protein
VPRKLIAFHPEDLRALTELAEDRAASLQELLDEAVRDLLKKHGRPTDLKSALRASAKADAKAGGTNGRSKR